MSLDLNLPKEKDMSKPLTRGELIREFEDFLTNNGLQVDKKGLVTDGSIGRAYITDGSGAKLVGWYQVWFDQSIPFGRCGDYRLSHDDPIATWKPDNEVHRKLTDEDREQIAAAKRKYEEEKLAAQEQCAINSNRIWDAAEECTAHPYLTKKAVQSHGLRVHSDGRLIVPVLNDSLRIVGLQYINDDGDKRFEKDTNKSGHFYMIGADKMSDTDKIYYCEGYATAASVFTDMQSPVIIAFDAYNLSPVSKTFFGHFKDKTHVFIADNDPKSNTGQTEAEKAAQVIKNEGGQTQILMPATGGDYNAHKLSEDMLPVMKSVEVPTEFDFMRNSSGRALNTKDNVRGVMLTEKITVNYNVIKKRMEIDIPNMKFISDMKEEASLIEIEDRCIQMAVPHTRVRDYIKILANEYNPVKEWIFSRPWDGQSRLQEFLDTITEERNKELKETLMRKWLISCVAAALEPNGVALEGILVLQGAQGLGKTLWFKKLADYEQGWLLEGATLNPTDKDSVKQAVSHWIVELGELESTFKKADLDMLKAFITKKTDEMRLPYDRAATTYQRRTAFYASVNAREFLTDTSGNRRFWAIPVKDININHSIDMQQLWAEVAMTLYKPDVKNWFLTPEERAALQDQNESFRAQSSVEDLILNYVRFDSANCKPVQMTTLLRDLGITNPRMPDIKDASRVLAERGIEPRKSNGKKVYDLDYEKPKNMDTGGYGNDLNYPSF